MLSQDNDRARGSGYTINVKAVMKSKRTMLLSQDNDREWEEGVPTAKEVLNQQNQAVSIQ
jgi:hypothetical protein